MSKKKKKKKQRQLQLINDVLKSPKGNNNMSSQYPYTTGGNYGTSGYTSYGCGHDGGEEDALFGIKVEERMVTFYGSKETYVLDNLHGEDNALIINMTGSGVSRGGGDIIKRNDLAPIVGQNGAVIKTGYDLSKYEIRKVFSEIVVDCKDQHAPMLYPDFWLEIRRIIQENPFNKVIPCCMGGHGRTGTALACLYLAFYADDGERAYKDVVKGIYCGKAVETNEQKEYIKYVAKYFDTKLKKDQRLKPLKIVRVRTKDKDKGSSKSSSTGSDSTSSTKSSTSNGQTSPYDDYDMDGLVCVGCGKSDTTVIPTEVDGKEIMECDSCYQKRFEKEQGGVDPKEDKSLSKKKCKSCGVVDETVTNSYIDEHTTIAECSGCWQKRMRDGGENPFLPLTADDKKSKKGKTNVTFANAGTD